MDSFTSISRDMCESNIKFDRKYVRGQMLWVVFNISITCFDAKILMDNHSVFSGVAFGAMLVTSLWSLLFLIESWSELRNEKRKFKFLSELHDAQIASAEREQYLNAKQHYEYLTESLKKN